jgi:hypothetical protein
MGRGQFEATPVAAPAADEDGPDWNRQTPYEMDSPEE